MNTETTITADIIDSVVDNTRGLIYLAELWMAARVALVIVGGAMAFIAVMIGIMELASGLV